MQKPQAKETRIHGITEREKRNNENWISKITTN